MPDTNDFDDAVDAGLEDDEASSFTDADYAPADEGSINFDADAPEFVDTTEADDIVGSENYFDEENGDPAELDFGAE